MHLQNGLVHFGQNLWQVVALPPTGKRGNGQGHFGRHVRPQLTQKISIASEPVQRAVIIDLDTMDGQTILVPVVRKSDAGGGQVIAELGRVAAPVDPYNGDDRISCFPQRLPVHRERRQTGFRFRFRSKNTPHTNR